MGLINPDTGSKVEVEPDGDYTVTFSMTLPTPATDEPTQTRIPIEEV